MNKSTYKYKAFISYSHADERIGKWIHKKIERFRVPKKLIYKKFGIDAPKRIYPIFRDREELPTASNLGEVINNALTDSEFLIVICSPNSAKSLWVNEEIKYFKKLGRQNDIVCLIIDGIPNKPKTLSAELKCMQCNNGLKLSLDERELGVYFCPYCKKDISHFNKLEECLAPELLDKDSNESISKTKLHTVDIRSSKDGKKKSLLKIVAFLIALPFEKLFEAIRKRRKKRLAISVIFSPFILWTIFVAGYGLLILIFNSVYLIFPPKIGTIELNYEIVGHTKGKINLEHTREIQAIALRSKGLFVFDELKIGRTRESVLPSINENESNYLSDLYINEHFEYKDKEKLEIVGGWNTRISENELNFQNSSSNYIVTYDEVIHNKSTIGLKPLSKRVGGYVTCNDKNKISAIKNSLPAGCYHLYHYEPGPIWVSFNILKIKDNSSADEFFTFNLLSGRYRKDDFIYKFYNYFHDKSSNSYLSIFVGGENGAFKVDKYDKHFDDNPSSPVESIETETILTPNTFFTVVLKIESVSDDFDEEFNMHSAVISGDIKNIEKCINLGGDVTLKDDLGVTPLELWFNYTYNKGKISNYEIPRLLIQNGADINALGAEGLALLHLAADLGLTTLIQFLLDNGADIDVGNDIYKDTPLIFSVLGNEPDAFRLLIKRGAKINLINNFGMTAMDFAKNENRSDSFIALLRENGAKTAEELKAAGN